MAPAALRGVDFVEFWASIGGVTPSLEKSAEAFLRAHDVETFRDVCERDLDINFISSLRLEAARRRQAAAFCLAARRSWQAGSGLNKAVASTDCLRSRHASKRLDNSSHEKIFVDHAVIQRLRSNSAPEADITMFAAAATALTTRQPRVAFDKGTKGGQGHPGEDVSDIVDEVLPEVIPARVQDVAAADEAMDTVAVRDRRSWRYKCLRVLAEAPSQYPATKPAAVHAQPESLNASALQLRDVTPSSPAASALSPSVSSSGSEGSERRSRLPPPPPASSLPPPPGVLVLDADVAGSFSVPLDNMVIQRLRSNSAPEAYITRFATAATTRHLQTTFDMTAKQGHGPPEKCVTDQIVLDICPHVTQGVSAAEAATDWSMDWPLSRAETRVVDASLAHREIAPQ
jgi:hypothetical protein